MRMEAEVGLVCLPARECQNCPLHQTLQEAPMDPHRLQVVMAE